MFHRVAALSLVGFMLASGLTAQGAGVAGPRGSEPVDNLFEALALPEMIGIMAEEGNEYGLQVAQDLIPGGITADWTRAVAAIYDTSTMEAQVYAAFSRALDGVDVTPMLAFFEAEQGRTIVRLEVSARRALLDDAVEEASKDMATIARTDQTERFALIEDFVRVNDLIETNVVGAMNANLAFYNGLAMGGALPETLTQDQILADVWGQEPQIRENTTEWVYSFLLMAYQPLSDEDIVAYTAFSQTDAGEALNAAIFAAFDVMFEDISHALGVAAAAQMITREL